MNSTTVVINLKSRNENNISIESDPLIFKELSDIFLQKRAMHVSDHIYKAGSKTLCKIG